MTCSVVFLVGTSSSCVGLAPMFGFEVAVKKGDFIVQNPSCARICSKKIHVHVVREHVSKPKTHTEVAFKCHQAALRACGRPPSTTKSKTTASPAKRPRIVDET